jgi:hypothetical protein
MKKGGMAREIESQSKNVEPASSKVAKKHGASVVPAKLPRAGINQCRHF